MGVIVKKAAGGGGLSAVAGTEVAHDSFDRADATTLGNAGVGGAWSQVGNQYGIQTNKAYAPAFPPGGESTALLGIDVANVLVGADFGALGSGLGQPGVVLRAQDATNFYYAYATASGDIRIMKKIANVDTQLSFFTTIGAPPFNLQFMAVGSTLWVFRNGDVIAAVTDTQWTHGGVGLHYFTNSGAFNGTFDEFYAVAVA